MPRITLEDGEEAFGAVHVSRAAHVFLVLVVDRVVSGEALSDLPMAVRSSVINVLLRSARCRRMRRVVSEFVSGSFTERDLPPRSITVRIGRRWLVPGRR